MLLGSNVQVGLDQAQATNALLGLIGLYATDGFKIVAGIIGICMASKNRY